MSQILILISAFALLPTAELYSQSFEFDKGHTFINFSVERFGSARVIGRFNEFNGTLNFDPAKQQILNSELSINANSLDTGHDVRDGHLKGNIWLDTQNYKEIKFSLTSIISRGSSTIAKGNLTIKDITKMIEFPVVIKGPNIDPTKNTTIGISASLKINRQDFGLSFSKLMDNGALFIGNEVIITVEALAQQTTSRQ